MSNLNSIEREQKKRQLKRRMIDTATQKVEPSRSGNHGNNDDPAAKEGARPKHKRMRGFLALGLVLVLLAAGFMYYKENHAYTDFTVAWEKEIAASESSTTEFVAFGENVLKYTRDGASYLDKSGKAIWSMSYELKAPICYVNGDYAVIGDQQGNDIYIVDKTGCQGQATTLLPIMRISVSAYGVAAALVEDSSSSYVTFFKKDGSQLDWAIKTVMSGNGYLMDVSLSPDGTQVMLSDLYLQDGALKNRIVFYNFSEYGKNYPDRLVGGFDELGDSICPRVRFLDEDHACAFATGQVAFFSLENVTSPALIRQAVIEGEIRGVAWSKGYVAVVSDNSEGGSESRLSIFKADGTASGVVDFSYSWRNINIQDDFVILSNENSCRVYSLSGKERFAGEFDFSVAQVTRGHAFNSLIISGGDRMREIRLK